MVAQEVTTNYLEWLKDKLLFFLKMCDEGFIKYNFSNLGTYEDNFFDFNLTQGRELFCKTCKSGGFLVQGFHKLYKQTKFNMQNWSKNYITFHKWFVLDIVFSLRNFISDWAILAYIMFNSSSGIP